MEKRLSDSEKEIMEAVWRSKHSVRVSDVFGKTDGWKYTTVSTFLTRLVKKGFLKCEKEGNQNYYSPLMSRGEYQKLLTDDFVRDVYGNSASELIASLCRDRISEDDYRELMDALERYDKK